MCFYIPNSQLKALKAKKDISVFKLMKPIWEQSFWIENTLSQGEIIKGKYSSWHRNFMYEDGYEYSNSNFSRLRKDYYGAKGEGQGLHSFPIRKKPFIGFGQVKVKCYIPKGAYYFYNRGDGEYFSNRLVVIGKIREKKKE